MAELPSIEGWKEGTEEDITIMHNCYCINCHGSKGTTTMLPTKVPMFREIIIMAFECPLCSFRNSEVTFGGEIQTKGIKYTLEVKAGGNRKDLDRQIVKSDSCTIYIPEIEFEIPMTTQRGSISTLEGVLSTAANNLQEGQEFRLQFNDNLQTFHKCQHVINTLREYIDDSEDTEFTFQMDDPAGNSFIENLCIPNADPQLNIEYYERSPNHDMLLGLQPSNQAREEGYIDDTNPLHKNIVNASNAGNLTIDEKKNIGREEAIKFQTNCPHCFQPAETDMCVTDIPHFKEVIIMSLACDHCGYKSNEIKGGGAIPKYGTKITLEVKTNEDLAREVLKSDTSGIELPTLEFELEHGGLDGVYTTVEGLLQKMHQRLVDANPFGSGDSSTKHHLGQVIEEESHDGQLPFSKPSETTQNYLLFLSKLDAMSKGEILPFTLIIMDPISNSFIGPIPKDAIALAIQAEKDGNNQCYDEYIDSQMTIEEFERTFDMNEILGLNDMNTENYHDGDDKKEYYGTDQMEALPDRIRKVDIRGPDHPLLVGKGTDEGDTTVMGPGSTHFAVPSIAQRGKQVDN